MNNLFNEQLFNKYLNDIEISQNQLDLLNLWNQKLTNGELIAETSNYHYFEKVFLNKLLGYDTFTDILADDKEISGSGKSEFKLKRNNEVFMIIELKGSNINLDKSRNNKNETPVDQVFRYAKKNEAVPWLLVSNYDEFRLYNYHKGDGKYISWTIKELINNENKLKEFMFVLGKNSFENKIIDNLIDKTIIIQEDFNDEFYKLYSETRLMLIHDLEETSEDIDRLKAIHYAQLIMDRVIFICFAEDKGLLPEQILEDTVLTPIRNNNVRKHRIFDRLRELFEDIHEGNPGKDVSEYNGGLFKERLWFLDIQDTIENPTKYYENCFSHWKFESQKNETEELLGEYKDSLNPIYKNFLTMSIFNFDSDVDVNILGHIFESSISDIEKLKEDNSETRHKFGIHYTPQEITQYICENTIIPYLSKTGNVNDIPELLSEYENDIEILDKKLKEIKILDPACGSGAFLNKAVDTLLSIHEAVYHRKYDNKTTLDMLWDNESVRRDIILNNIYGVDLNEESTEITKLGLFLKICKKDKKLPSLDNNIKCGNSVIDDPEYAGEKAFKWEEEFKEIIENGGFDVVIGNPPYVRQEIIKESKQYFEKEYRTFSGLADLYVYFFEKGLSVLRNNGILGFICSNKYTKSKYGLNLRKLLLSLNILKYNDYTGKNIFDSATVDTSIIILQKKHDPQNKILIDEEFHLPQNKLDEKTFTFEKLENINLKNKIKSEGTLIKDLDIIINFGIKTGFNKAFIINEETRKKILKEDLKSIKFIKPLLRGRDINKWQKKFSNLYLLLIKDHCEIKKEYPVIYNYLKDYEEKLKNRAQVKRGDHHWTELDNNPSDELCSLFEEEKIIYGEIVPEPRFVYDNEQYFGEATTFIMNSFNINLKYMVALLNSDLLFWYFKDIGYNLGGKGYRYKKIFVEQLPIKISKENESMFDNIINDIQNKSNDLNNEINGFLKWLQSEYNINKTSQKLERYYELTLEEFLTELRKKKVNTKNRKNRENLEEEFNNSLEIIKPLQIEIRKLEEEINQKVYELYNLTEEEIKIIEESLKE